MKTFPCWNCGEEYTPTRQPALTKRNYCTKPECLKARARDAKRAQRQRELQPHCRTCRCPEVTWSTDHKIQEAYYLRSRGWTLQRIATKLGCTPSGVAYLLRRASPAVKRQYVEAEPPQEEDFEDNLSALGRALKAALENSGVAS